MRKRIIRAMACTFILFNTSSSLAIPAVNQYHMMIRPNAKEPIQYDTTTNATSKAIQPTYNEFTLLNTLNKDKRYSIPPYPFTSQLPKIGNWMVASENENNKTKLAPAHWLNMLSSDGRYIIEPINYLFIVKSDSKKRALKKLIHTLHQSGFSTKWSGEKYHSGGYHTYLNSTLLTQIKGKNGIDLTFSNNFWLNQNDHFRVMGIYPAKLNHEKVYLFVSSASEESNWSEKNNVGHYFVSFDNARNNLATALIENNLKTYYVIIKNTLNTAKETTEDHDGNVFITLI